MVVPTPANGSEPVTSRIVIDFEADDPANPHIRMEHVNLGQVMAASKLLDLVVMELRAQQLAPYVTDPRPLFIPGSPGSGKPWPGRRV